MKLSYKQQIFLCFFILFSIFTLSVIIIQQRSEKKEKTEFLEKTLENYTNATHKYIKNNGLDVNSFDRLRDLNVFPDSVRISIIDDEGRVLYDTDIQDLSRTGNHLDRPEIQHALSDSQGMHIRRSASAGQEYIYYAKHFPDYFIRMALPYDLKTRSLLDANRHFVYVIIVLFIIVLVIMNYVAGRFENSILQLKNFITRIKNNENIPADEKFPDDELGEIGSEIMSIFLQKGKSNRRIEIEREKLLLHFQYSEKGICIFTPDFKKIYANGHFMYFLNLVLGDASSIDINTIFEYDSFRYVKEFLSDSEHEQNHYEYNVVQNEKTFGIQTVLFDDLSFEITIRDITAIEQNRLLKQQMTSNIAHELKTPVTGIYAYLESLREEKFPPEMRKLFIERAFLQAGRLVELIDDVSIISKIEEAPSLFKTEDVNISQLINDIKFEVSDRLKKNNMTMQIHIDRDVTIRGNATLLYSIFRNLIDNTLKYAGTGVEINIRHYLEDADYHYFLYSDNGKGVEKEHLNRIFERFYRVDKGRTRESGGTGLGLSIVKNAVLFHKGKIEAQIPVRGGLKFLFTFKKFYLQPDSKPGCE